MVLLCPCEAGARGLEGGMEMQVQKQLRRAQRVQRGVVGGSG